LQEKITSNLKQMNIIVNNSPHETAATTLAQLAAEQNLPHSGVAVAVNNQMVPRTEWDSFALQDGQKITILKAFSGG
jgi:sulfur carrier protein